MKIERLFTALNRESNRFALFFPVPDKHVVLLRSLKCQLAVSIELPEERPLGQ